MTWENFKLKSYGWAVCSVERLMGAAESRLILVVQDGWEMRNCTGQQGTRSLHGAGDLADLRWVGKDWVVVLEYVGDCFQVRQDRYTVGHSVPDSLDSCML